MNDKVYKTIFVEWRGRHSYTSLTLHNLTKEQAIENAKFFGWEEPRKWQFWKAKLPNIMIYD